MLKSNYWMMSKGFELPAGENCWILVGVFAKGCMS